MENEDSEKNELESRLSMLSFLTRYAPPLEVERMTKDFWEKEFKVNPADK